jgi:hypothetical protein
MNPAGRFALCGFALAAGSVAAMAQSVISAHSGLIHYIEGQVYLGDTQVETKAGTFPEVKENAQLRTGEGRAEVLLTPGVFLRLGENSSFRMVTNRLIDTRLEFLSGSAVVEAADIPKDNSVTVVYKEAAVHFPKKGIYRFDASPGQLRVYDGEAEVTAGDKNIQVKEGHELAFDTLAVNNFDKKVGDTLNRWSERRAEYIAMANVSAANSVRTSAMYGGDVYSSLGYGGYGYGGYGYGMGGYGLGPYDGFGGGWFFNPYFGMFTFVPGMMGAFYSPYGYRLWSPFDVYMAYMPGMYYGFGPNYYGGGGYGRAYNNAGYRASVPVRTMASRGSTAVGRAGAVGSGRGISAGSGSSGISSGRSAGSISSVGSVGRGGGGGGGGGHR